MKKIFKIIGISLLVIILLLIAVPFLFQSQIKDLVKNYINKNLNANVEFSDVDLSMFRNFPNARVEVSDLVITNFEPFEDETFATAKDISFTMSIKELFKSAEDDPIVVKSIQVNEALMTLKIDENGNENFDIVKETPQDTSSNGFKFDIKDYGIKNSALTYIDLGSKTEVYVTELNHTGKGTFSDTTSELDTRSEANVSLSMDSVNYLDNNLVKLDAVLDLNLKEQIYTFKENTGYINQLPIEFNGWVQSTEEGSRMDLTFENKGSSFKDFLAVIPKTYSKNLDDVETTGNFKVKGIIKGDVTETTIPTLDIRINSDNASFKYPNLPKKVENILINASILNTTGDANDTYVNLEALNFKIDQDVFKSSATIRNLTENMLVDADIDGTINLANLTKAYPLELENELSGILKGKINAAFDMNAIETSNYSRIRTSGNASMTNVVFTSDAMNQPFNISRADMTFNPATVSLNTFEAKTGKSDISAKGTISNLIGFLLTKNANLKGNFNLTSKTLAVSDFMAEESSTGTTASETTTNKNTKPVKIPEFLECDISANVNNVLYDNLVLKDMKGTLSIKDQQATLNSLTSNIFNGQLTVSGIVNTKTDTPSFNMTMTAKDFDISQSFRDLELLQNLAPIANALQGKINTSINLSGALDSELSPNLKSVTGNALAELLTTSVNENASAILGQLEGALNFIDFSQLDLRDVKANLEFANGMVNIKPFDLKYKDIGITISGSHGFDKSLTYNTVFNVPAKYLGSEVNRLIGKINDPAVNNITIPVGATISGSFSNPKVSTDLASGVSNLTKQLIEIEKQKLLSGGKDKINDILGGILGGNNNPSTNPTNPNSTTTDTTKVVKADTTKTKNDPIKEGVKDVLGGLLNNKKKDEKKDDKKK